MAVEGSRGVIGLNSVDRRGREIEPTVLAAAEGIYSRALEHGVRLVGDPAVVTTALEEVAATVSRARRVKCAPANSGHIRDLRAYLFRAFLRHLNRLKRKELSLVSLNEVCQIPSRSFADALRELETKMLLDECLAQFDFVERDMAWRRMQGFSWDEIGKLHSLSAHAAEAKFSRALQQARSRLKILK